MCHGLDGKAHTPIARKIGVKDLTQSTASSAAVEKQIAEGSKDKKGAPKMTPFKDRLSPVEIKEMAEFVMTLRQKN